MRKTTVDYSCDACHVEFEPEKGTPFLAFADDMRRKTANTNPIARFSMHPWREDLAASGDAKHFCSVGCAIHAAGCWAVTLPAKPETALDVAEEAQAEPVAEAAKV